MKFKAVNYFSVAVLAVAFVAMGASTAQAVPITITPGNPGNAGTDNVLFNDGNLIHTGPLVQGNFNGSGSGFIVDFTSSSGSGLLEGTGGQATIIGGPGNSPFTSLTFGLEAGATFTKAILNPDATVDGTINFTVVYMTAAGSPFLQSFSIDGAGQNFFGIEAGDGARIITVTFDTADSAFINSAQFRLGGFEPASAVPDGGTTLALACMAFGALGFLRRKIS